MNEDCSRGLLENWKFELSSHGGEKNESIEVIDDKSYRIRKQ
jgi:hypothetical protein